ncbi:hypothetical protein ACFQJ5_14485 [Halomicroarcula sp. GCM10025324]|uniref:DUF7289 family protein n=1 Tax=Haloarcula TaxID=2237 RepID=UPI0023E8B32D|nr:polymer-forming cytoskeletal protein [Halomicroarcula sp. ZS-22-S1]
MLRSLGQGGTQRAQSAPLGLLLVFSMVIVGSTLVVGLGATALTDTEAGLDVSRSEKVMTQLDSEAAMVALGSSNGRQVSLSQVQGARYRVDDGAGRMEITITNTSADPATTTTLLDVDLGAVVYENEDRQVAYQGGGVWKKSRDGTVMISPPEFYYRDATLTLPLITVSGDTTLSGRASLTPDETTQVYPDAGADRTNPLETGVVNVTVTSEYYRAWGRYFEERTDGSAMYDHENQRVTTTLTVPTGPREVTSAVAATAAGGEIRLSGNGGDPARTDSYDSSVGTGAYADTRGAFGTVTTAGDVVVTGNSEVNGSIRSGDRVEVKGSGWVNGSVEYTSSKKIKGTVEGSVSQIGGVDGAAPIDGYVQQQVDNASAENDNGDTGAITGNTLASGDRTLTEGVYYLERVRLDGDTLTLDTGTGDITLAVRDYVHVENDGRIEVVGDGQVRVFVQGEATSPSGAHFSIPNSGGVVDVADNQNASQFWLYGKSGFKADLDGSGSSTIRYEGVIYAPAGIAGSSDVYIGKAHLYGGIVAGSVELDNGGTVHYDQALLGQRAIPPQTNIIRLTYLHISENELNVTNG